MPTDAELQQMFKSSLGADGPGGPFSVVGEAVRVRRSDQHLERIFASLVRELSAAVREDLAKGPAVQNPVRSGWATPPKAARLLHVPLKRVRALIAAGRVKTRRRGNPYAPRKKGERIEVHLESLEAALNGDAPAPPIDLAQMRARGGK